MFIALSPAASIYILLFGWMLCFGAPGRRVFLASVLVSVAWFFILPGLLAQGVAITQINLTLSGPLLIFSFLALLAMAGLRLLRSFSADVVIMGVVSIILLASVFYDFQYRNGLVTTGAALAPLGSAVFVTFVGYISVKHYTLVNLELARANVNLRLALEDQSEQLKADFAKVTLLERQAAVREEVSRLTRELHDGVLSYLGIINVVSEAGKDETLARIHQLSRLATNEIRIILDARPSDEASLAIAMSSLKQHVVDPLRLAGVSVEWSTRALTDYGRVEPKFLMNVVRIVQEAIHNAVISAGSVHLSVLAEHSDRVTCITITNTGGQPFCDDDKSGLGIVSMHERARKIGARLDIAPLPDGAILTLKMAQNNLG
jgi:signal transduction histidine kinase